MFQYSSEGNFPIQESNSLIRSYHKWYFIGGTILGIVLIGIFIGRKPSTPLIKPKNQTEQVNQTVISTKKDSKEAIVKLVSKSDSVVIQPEKVIIPDSHKSDVVQPLKSNEIFKVTIRIQPWTVIDSSKKVNDHQNLQPPDVVTQPDSLVSPAPEQFFSYPPGTIWLFPGQIPPPGYVKIQ